eukprot:756506-Hanusia_phi.AAC.10
MESTDADAQQGGEEETEEPIETFQAAQTSGAIEPTAPKEFNKDNDPDSAAKAPAYRVAALCDLGSTYRIIGDLDKSDKMV